MRKTPEEISRARRRALLIRNAKLRAERGPNALREIGGLGMGRTPAERRARGRLLSDLGVAARLGRAAETRRARAALARYDALMRAAHDREGGAALPYDTPSDTETETTERA